MATVQEMMDAAATTETAAKMSAGDTFEGNLDTKNDEDWIRIELTAGMVYTFSLSGVRRWRVGRHRPEASTIPRGV